VTIRYASPEPDPEAGGAVLEVQGMRQGRPWWASIETARESPGHLVGRVMDGPGCFTARARYALHESGETRRSPWSNEIQVGDCISPEPEPVPEPGRAVLLGFGVGLLAVLSRHRAPRAPRERLPAPA